MVTIHRQMGHMRKEAMVGPLQSAQQDDEMTRRILKRIEEGCQTCRVFKPTPTALEGVTTSQAVAHHIKAMNETETEKKFKKVKCDKRSRRALRRRVRAVERHYHVGKEVYYKQDEEKNRWCGPATVIGNKGMWHFLVHQGVILRVAANRLVIGEQDKKGGAVS